MRRLLRRMLAGVMVSLAVGWPAAVFAQQVEPTVVALDNGLELLLVERHEQPFVAGGVFYDVGSVNDPAGRSGIAHLFEHMLFKGSKIIGTTDYEAERPIIEQQDALRAEMNAEMDHMRLMKRRGEIDDVLDPEQWTPKYTELKKRYDALIETHRPLVKNNEFANTYSSNGGVRVNAGTTNDLTLYLVQLPSNKLELFFWLEADRMANAVMREFYIERDNVREERRLSTESTPTGKFREAFEALFWQTHPYGAPVLGWASEVESITRDDVRDFFRKYYVPNNATVILVGDFDTAHVVKLAKRYFGRIPRGKTLPPMLVTEEPPPLAHRRFEAEAETNPQAQIRYHGVAIGHADEAALDVATQLLAGKTGRLYKRLITEEDAAIGVPQASTMARKYAGYVEVSAVAKEGHDPEQVEQLILEEIAKLADGEISDRELQKVKNQVLASSVSRLRSNMGLMFQLGFYDTWLDWTYMNDNPKRMLAVVADDVRRVTKKYLDPEVRTVAIYRTKEGAAGTAEEDPELTALLESMPTDQRAGVKQAISQIGTVDDIEGLRQQAGRMEQMSGAMEMTEEQRAVFDYMLKTIKARIAELEAASQEESK